MFRTNTVYLGRIEFDQHTTSKVDHNVMARSESLSEDEAEEHDLHDMPSLRRYDSVGLDEEEVKRDDVGHEDEVKTDQHEEGTKKQCTDSQRNRSDNSSWDSLSADCPERVRKLIALFQIAECYEIEELLLACCAELRESVDLQSCVLLMLHLAKYEHLEDIKHINKHILDYTIRNIKAVKKTDGYRYILQNKPDLVDVIIDRLAEREDTRIIV